VVEELLPALVSLVAEVDVYEGVFFRFYGSLDEGQASLFWRSATLFDITFGAGADDICPARLSSHTSRNDVVERKLAGGLFFAAILAAVFVSCEDISSVELDIVSRQAVVEQKANDSGHGDVEVDGRDPVLAIRLEGAFELAYLAPALEVVVRVAALFEGDDFCKLSAQQGECPSGSDDADSHIVLVQDEHIAIETGFNVRSKHN